MNKSVKIIPFPEIKNAYIIISAAQKECDFMDVFAIPTFSFFYDNNGSGAEWCPPHGPIQVWNKCEETDENARYHYFYGHINNGFGNWSQMAVEREGFHQAFLNGDYSYIFTVLEKWADR